MRIWSQPRCNVIPSYSLNIAFLVFVLAKENKSAWCHCQTTQHCAEVCFLSFKSSKPFTDTASTSTQGGVGSQETEEEKNCILVLLTFSCHSQMFWTVLHPWMPTWSLKALPSADMMVLNPGESARESPTKHPAFQSSESSSRQKQVGSQKRHLGRGVQASFGSF